MKVLHKFFPLFLLFGTGSAFASEPPSIMEVETGKPFPVAPAFEANGSNPFPSYQFLIPNTGKLQSIFPQYTVTINRQTRNVIYLSAKTAFISGKECLNKLATVEELILKTYPELSRDEEDRALRSQNGNVYAYANCVFPEGSAYVVLSLDIRNKKENLAMQEAWDAFENR